MSDSDYVRLSYRPDLRVLFMRWTRPATSAEHQAGYQAALELARPQQAGCWLIDLRSRGLADAPDLVWILEDFRRAFQAAVPNSTRRIAYFTTPYHAGILVPRLAEYDKAGNNGTEIKVFVEETPACQWLQS
ncbi:hypothetical protein CDA63_08635 [Hymenobacter amundsenii]|uniref:STAS/SEC14 domain-containing protein n=1 Tax=Hymenobacter amundsenii TaxID=2006685 RepID=A0A246FL22_9BACT|nr:hypothetical protein [Hymenobacter amundsenii]OWP63438.1 hypothetical protein CDA63_08635 [Hymenobacter amundsenii]